MISLPKFSRARLKTLLIWSGGALALFALVGFFAVPPILKSVLTSKLGEALHRKVEIAEIRVNPFALSVTVRGLTVQERDGKATFASFEELYLNLQSSSLFRLAPVLSEIRLVKPYARIVRQREFEYNFSDLLAGQKTPAKEPKPGEKSGLPRFSMNNIRVIDAGADFIDEPVGKTHTVRKVNVGIPFLSTIPSQVNLFVEPALSAEVNGTHYAAKGKTKPFVDSMETVFEINVDKLDLPFYVAYSPVPLKFSIPSGRLDARLALSFVQPQKQPPSLTITGDVGVKDLGIDDLQKNPVFRLQAVDVGIAAAEPLARKIHLARIAIQSPKLTVQRDKGGTVNLETLLPSPPAAAEKAATRAVEPTPASPPFLLRVDQIDLSDGGVTFADLSTPVPFKTRLEPITLGVRQLSTEKDAKASYTLTVLTEAKEAIAVEGSLSLTPLATEGSASLKGVPLKKYAPYYAERVLFDIESGKLDLSARYQIALAEKGPDVKASDIAVTLGALRLRKRGESQDFLSVPGLSVKNAAVDLGQMQATVGSIATQKGTLTVIRLPSGEVDLQKLLPPPPAGDAAPAATPQPSQKPAAQKPFVVTLNRLTVDDYAVTIEDRVPTQPVTILAERIRLTGENLSTAKGSTGKIELSLLLDKTATFSLKTSAGLDPLRASGTLEAGGLLLPRYAPYYRDQIRFDLDEGSLGLSTGFSYAQKDGGFDAALADLAVSLKSVRLKNREDKTEFFSLPSFSIRNTSVDLGQQTVKIGGLDSEGAVVRVKRARNGDVNLLMLLPEKPVTELRGGSPPGAPAGAGAAVEKPWMVSLGAAAITGYTIHLEDALPADPVKLTVDQIAVKAGNLSTQRDQKGTLSLDLRVNQTGSLHTEGAVGLTPPTADLQVDMKAMDLRPLQPYFTDKVKIVLTSGNVLAQGRATLALREEGTQATYQGGVLIGQFASVDKRAAEDLLRWDSLGLGDVDFSLNPFRAHVKRVALSNFFARVVIRPDATINLQDLLEKGEAPAPASSAPTAPAATTPAAAAAPADIRIDEVTLQGGRVAFSDASVKSGYSAALMEIGGRVSGLSSQPGTVAELDLRGRLENSAPLEITGKINPLLQDLFVDIRARFKDMDLSPLTPYSGKYAGYTIEKGKLAFDLKYNIERRKLNSENVISVDQFTFGEKVDSPTATGLPVKLAIALLKDRNGLIRLDIPVTGSLDDPQFSIWGVVWQIIGNLIAKAITSPFALIGSMFGGGEELNTLEFDYGQAAISGPSAEKLAKLVKGLASKPGINMDLTAYVDPDRDRDGLLQVRFTQKLQAQKAMDLARRGGVSVPTDQLAIEPPEYEKYLKMAYDFEKFPKPRNMIGMVKGLPAPEMQKLILTNIKIGDDDLHALARQRAQNIQEAILQSGEVASERLFLVEGKPLAPEKKGDLKGSRVELAIKN